MVKIYIFYVVYVPFQIFRSLNWNGRGNKWFPYSNWLFIDVISCSSCSFSCYYNLSLEVTTPFHSFHSLPFLFILFHLLSTLTDLQHTLFPLTCLPSIQFIIESIYRLIDKWMDNHRLNSSSLSKAIEMTEREKEREDSHRTESTKGETQRDWVETWTDGEDTRKTHNDVCRYNITLAQYTEIDDSEIFTTTQGERLR